MAYIWASFRTLSYWQYALFSVHAVRSFLSWIGGVWLFLEVFDYFNILAKGSLPNWSFFAVIGTALLFTLFAQRPLSRIAYKVPTKDICIEVRIADVFDVQGQTIISSNTTFDTSIADGIISPNSLQGQFVQRYFKGVTEELDRMIAESLSGKSHTELTDKSYGKTADYPIGTVARVTAHGRLFYFLAMARMNKDKTAESSVGDIDTALEGLWKHIRSAGEREHIVMPIVGTGRGRIALSRRKMIERIAQSFIYASNPAVFANKLTIVVHPDDASAHYINLFEVLDYLKLSLDA